MSSGNYNVKKPKLNKTLKFACHFVIFFCFLFEAPLIGAITTRRVSVAAALLVVFSKRNIVKKLWKTMNQGEFFLSMCGFVFCMIVSLVNGIGLEFQSNYNYFEPVYVVYMILYIIIFAFYSAVVFENAVEFAKVYVAIMIFQSFIVFGSAINTGFRMFLYNNFYFGDGRFGKTIMWGTRVIGMNLHSSSGSIILCTSCVLLIYLYIKENINNLLFIILYIIIMAATMFIGRTGFYIEIVFLLLCFVLNGGIAKKVMSILGVSMLLLVVGVFVFSRLESYVSAYFISWIGEVFNPETRFNTVNAIRDMPMPKMSLEMVFGTNIMFGITPSGELMYSDSGYAKIYCAIGIVGAAVYYLSIFRLYVSAWIQVKTKASKIFLLMLILIAFVLEFKEPFFLKYLYAWMVYVILLFEIKSNIKFTGGWP